MSTMLNPRLLTALGTISASYVFFWALLRLTHDSREPPVLLSAVPFIGPVLGMIRWSINFYAHMRYVT